MIEYRSTIETVFQIEGYCVLCPGIPRDVDAHVRVGDHVYLLGTDRGCIDTVVHGIQLISGPAAKKGFPISIPKSISKDEIPIGATLHVIEDSPRDGKQGESVLDIGDPVRVHLNSRNTTPHTGVIEDKVWHHKYRLWYYFMRDSAGHRISKRYTAADLIPKPDHKSDQQPIGDP